MTFAKVMPNTSSSSSSPVNQIPRLFQDCPQWQLHQEGGQMHHGLAGTSMHSLNTQAHFAFETGGMLREC